MQVIERKDIQLNFKHNLIEVRPDKKEAVFALLDEGKEGQTTTVEVNCIVMIYIYILVKLLFCPCYNTHLV